MNRSYPWARACGCAGPACAAEFDPIAAGVINQVIDKFGYGPALTTRANLLLHNQVFSQAEVLSLSCKIWTLVDEGEPAVVRFKLPVLENRWWGIAGGREVDVLLFYLEDVTSFNEKLPDETQAQIAKGQDGMFSKWPIYKTTFHNRPEPTSYTMAQVNLLSALGEFAVLKNQALVRKFVSGP